MVEGKDLEVVGQGCLEMGVIILIIKYKYVFNNVGGL